MRYLAVMLLLAVAPAQGQTLLEQAQALERAGRAPEAVKLYVQAARSRDYQAALALGDIYRSGRPGVPANKAESDKWYNAASVIAAERAQQEAAAKSGMGVRTESPPLVTRDLGASSGAVTGVTLRQQAQGLERDGKNADAVKLYVRAARSGDGKAAFRLGEIYQRGIPGVPPDAGESRKWFNAARVLGEPPAQIAK